LESIPKKIIESLFKIATSCNTRTLLLMICFGNSSTLLSDVFKQKEVWGGIISEIMGKLKRKGEVKIYYT